MSFENQLSKMQFYNEFLSKSLPVVFKNEAKSWKFYTALEELGPKKHDAFINDLFKGWLANTPFA
jgi:hypothetical protein